MDSENRESLEIDIEVYLSLDISQDGKKLVFSKVPKQINQCRYLENFLPEKQKDLSKSDLHHFFPNILSTASFPVKMAMGRPDGL